MKIKYIFLSFAALLVGMSSCSKVLDIQPDGKIDLEDVWKDNDMVAAYLNSCYDNLKGKGIAGWWFNTNVPVAMCDDAWDADAEVETSLYASMAYNGVASASSHPILSENNGNASWNEFWKGIRKCNVFLERIDDAVVTKETDRARWKAEAQGLRAYYFSELFRFYGAQFPYMKYSMEYNDDFSGLKKNTAREIVDLICKDCDAVLAEEAVPWRVTSDSEKKRITKALAAAMKSRYTLYAASPLFATGQADAMSWEEAYKVNKECYQLLVDNGFELYKTCQDKPTFDEFKTKKQVNWTKGSDGAAAWHEYMCTGPDYSASPKDKETIYTAGGGAHGTLWNVQGVGFQGGYKCGLCPTQELVDAYENVEVIAGEAVASYPLLDLERPYLDEKHLVPNYNPENKIYDQDNPYVNKDPRFYATVVYNDCTRTCYWKNVEVDGRTGMTYGPGKRTKIIWTNKEDNYTGIHANARQQTRTGYYHNKFLRPDEGDNGAGGSAVPKHYRFSEVMLNLAETAICSGHVQEGIELINQIRDRVGMPAIPTSLEEDEALIRLKHERRIEFAFEEYRYDDIRRWQKPSGNLGEHIKWLTAMEISFLGQDPDGNDMYRYTRRNIRATARRNWENKWLFVPIPLSEQSKMEALTGDKWQNPGW